MLEIDKSETLKDQLRTVSQLIYFTPKHNHPFTSEHFHFANKRQLVCVGRQIQINRLTVCLTVTHLGWLLVVALCFTEFSIRLPKAGSAYFYSYATIGELCGFTVGWSMVLEHSIGVAIAAKAWSQYLGHISNDSLPKYSALINPFVWSNMSNQVYDMLHVQYLPLFF